MMNNWYENRKSQAVFVAIAAISVCVCASAEKPTVSAGHTAVTPVKRTDKYSVGRVAQIDKTLEKGGPFELVFLGDSITQGWERAGATIWERYYDDRKALNLGVSGDRTQHVLYRLDNGHFDGLTPQLVVLMIGTNNSNGDDNTVSEIADGIRAIVSKIRTKSPQTHILLLDIFPRGAEPNAQRGKIAQANQLLAKLDDGEFVHFLSIGQKFLDESGTIDKAIMPDFLHLSERGYEIWAEEIETKLANLLTVRRADAILDEAILGADRVRIEPSSADPDTEVQSEGVFETSDLEEIKRVRELIGFDLDSPVYYCMCFGEKRISFFKGNERLTTMTFHHDQSIRCDKIGYNIDLTAFSAAQLVKYLESK